MNPKNAIAVWMVSKILVGIKEIIVVICLYMCDFLIDNASRTFIELCSSYQFAWFVIVSSGVPRKLSTQWLGVKRQLDPRELMRMFAENLGALVLHQHVFFLSRYK